MFNKIIFSFQKKKKVHFIHQRQHKQIVNFHLRHVFISKKIPFFVIFDLSLFLSHLCKMLHTNIQSFHVCCCCVFFLETVTQPTDKVMLEKNPDNLSSFDKMRGTNNGKSIYPAMGTDPKCSWKNAKPMHFLVRCDKYLKVT